MVKRRHFLAMLGAAGALAGSELLLPKRSIFLPPIGGWPHGRIAHASLIVPRDEFAYGWWDADVATGRMAYDKATEVLSLLEFDSSAPVPSATGETMKTPNELTPLEQIACGSDGIFRRVGTDPFVYMPVGRAEADDARDAEIAEQLRLRNYSEWLNDVRHKASEKYPGESIPDEMLRALDVWS